MNVCRAASVTLKKIRKGAKPANLLISLAINRRPGRTVGVHSAVLARADEVIE